MGEKRGACRVLMGRHEIKRQFDGPRHGWEYKYSNRFSKSGMGSRMGSCEGCKEPSGFIPG